MMTPKKGDEVSYRALAGEIYPAIVSRVGPDGLLEIDVQLPGVTNAFGRTRVKWFDEKVAERGVCFPRDTPPRAAAPHGLAQKPPEGP